MAHKHHAGATPEVKMVIYPGEDTFTFRVPNAKGGTEALRVTCGHIYVARGEAYEMAGGLPPGQGRMDKLGGHFQGVTPAGHYVLDRAEQHTSFGWPTSVIPWGAKLREHAGEVQYLVGNAWHTATGPHGTVTRAWMAFYQRSHQHPDLKTVDQNQRIQYYLNGKLTPTYLWNDFGKRSWNMKRHGYRTGYYIHTSPVNELAHTAGQILPLLQSHGCVHIQPADRDELEHKGYLRAGVAVEVRPYGEIGPP
jgi:hypothetical protein